MKILNPALRALCCLLLVSGATGCKVDFPNVPYTCEQDVDCGGEGYVCAPLPDEGPRYCCKPEGEEQCNGVDDDCDGTIDVLTTQCYTGPDGTSGVGVCHGGTATCGRDGARLCPDQVVPKDELCNGLDDDCDGDIDEGFNLQADNAHCGTCARSCTFLETCIEGSCIKRTELDCANGLDDNGDGPVDCADVDDCTGRSCKADGSCVCKGGVKSEAACDNTTDDDNDGQIDCLDRGDCDNKSCGTGCTCKLGGKTESACGNGEDDDDDGKTDCLDPDCTGLTCGDGLSCRGVGANADVCREGNCTNNVDDDGDGKTDCADNDCNAVACGQGCTCEGLARKETNCQDGVDNGDGDGLADCADPDCGGAKCVPDEADAVCVAATKTCAETDCNDGSDNDHDTLTDCADRTDCDFAVAGQGSSGAVIALCVGGAKQETNCNNGQDDDGDGMIDCVSGNAEPNCVSGECGRGCAYVNCARRETDCADGVNNDNEGGIDCADRSDCDNKSCGNGCVCSSGSKKETLCNDGVDNDGNNGADCADSSDCPQGTVCRQGNGSAGVCDTNKACIPPP